MQKPGRNINEEYEKLFGSAKRINLFDTEEEYNELRQFIVDQSQEIFVSSILPFDGIEIILRKDSKRKREQINKSTAKEELSQLIRFLLDYSNREISETHLSLLNRKTDQPNPEKSETQDNVVTLKDTVTTNVVDPIKREQKKQNNVRFPKVERTPRYYYISRDMGSRSCNAKGIYDKNNDKFIIKEGSKLAYEVTSSYRYTASDIKRKKFIQENCVGKYDNKLKRDAICISPDEAACFVLGEKANGWVEWKSKDGKSLESYINKV